MAAQKPEEYEITASNGAVYRITGTAKEAEDIGAWIEQRIAAGDPALSARADVPHKAEIDKGGKRFEGVEYNDKGEVDRSGFLAPIDAFIRGGASGATSNMADEIAAAANTVIPLGQSTGTGWTKGFGKAYDDNLELQRQIDEADKSQHSFASGAGNLTGAVLQAFLAAKGLKAAAPMLPNRAIAPIAAAEMFAKTAPIRTAAVIGTGTAGVQGAAAGFGEGRTMDERVQNAKTGGTLGAMVGGVAAPVATSLAPAVARYASVIFGKAPEKEAVRQIIVALQRDGFDVTSPTGVKALKDELGNYLGKPVSLADIGNATRGRAGVGLRAPSDAQSQSIDAVMQRQQGQGSRLASDVRATVAPRTDVNALQEALETQRKEVALPLRDKALFEGGEGFGTGARTTEPMVAPTGVTTSEAPDAGLRRALGLNPVEAPSTFLPVPRGGSEVAVSRQARVPEDPMLQQLARLPFAQRALDEARKLAQAEVSRLSVMGEDISHLPDVIAPGSNLDMRTFDYLQRFLGTEADSLARGAPTNTFKAAEYGEVKNLRNAIRDRMRQIVPEYGEYLDAYSGSSRMIDALEEGRKFDTLDPEVIAAEQAKRVPAAQELYRVGAARNLMDTIRDTTNRSQPANRILNSPTDIDQLAATGIGAPNLSQITRSVDIERQFARLPAELGGSATQARQAAAADADAGVSATLPFNPGSPLGWVGAGVRGILNKANINQNAKVNEALLPRLLETDPAAISRTLDELVAAGKTEEARALARKVNTYRAMSVVGNTIGTASAVRNPEGM